MRFTCDQCQRRFDPTQSPFVPPVNHKHFCSTACRELWIETWEALYGKSVMSDVQDPDQLEFDLINQLDP